MRQLYNIHNKSITFVDGRFYSIIVEDKYHDANGQEQTRQRKVYVPAVSTYLEAYPKTAQFYEWLKSVGNEADNIRDEAGERGTVTHGLCEDFDNGLTVTLQLHNGQLPYSLVCWAMFERYVEFRKRYKKHLRLIENETSYTSLTHKMGGTLDRVFEVVVNGVVELWLLDIKTTNALHPHFWLQMAAYSVMYEEHTGIKINRICILWLSAKTKTDGDFGKTKSNGRGANKETYTIDADYIINNINDCDIQGNKWQLVFAPKPIETHFEIFKKTQSLWYEVHGDEVPRTDTYCTEYSLNDDGEPEMYEPRSEEAFHKELFNNLLGIKKTGDEPLIINNTPELTDQQKQDFFDKKDFEDGAAHATLKTVDMKRLANNQWYQQGYKSGKTT